MKQGSGKSRTGTPEGKAGFASFSAVHKGRRRAPVKKRRRKKPGTKDRLYAVLIAAVLIMAAGVLSFAVMYLNSSKNRKEAALTENSGASSSVQVSAAEETVQVEESSPSPAPSLTVAPSPAPVVKSSTQPAVTQAPVRAVEPASSFQAPSPPAAPAASFPPAGIIEQPTYRGKLAFVIDDAGYNLRDLEPFLKLSEPLTIAVLPGLVFSAEAARRIRAAGKEVFLHQPMEALGGQNPGPGAIRYGMDRNEIRSIILRNLEEIGPVAGINNHEGSRVTMDNEAMDTVLALCRERGLIFLDSRTTAETAAPAAARRLGINIVERDIFVDNIQERESMVGYINAGLARAEQRGSAIFIGHVQSAALASILAEMFPELRERGYSFSTVSALAGSMRP